MLSPPCAGCRDAVSMAIGSTWRQKMVAIVRKTNNLGCVCGGCGYCVFLELNLIYVHSQIKTIKGTKVSPRYPFLSRYPITLGVNLLTLVSI